MVTNASVFASGYVLDVTINNNGSSTVNGWIVNLPFDQDSQVEIFFGAEIETEGNTVIATPASWNQTIQPGQSWAFGFIGGHNGNFVEPPCIVVSP